MSTRPLVVTICVMTAIALTTMGTMLRQRQNVKLCMGVSTP